MKKKINNRLAGFFIGLLSPAVIGLPLILGLIALFQSYTFTRVWNVFMSTPNQESRFLSLAVLVNLGIFYFFLRKDWNRGAMGIVLGTMVYIPIIIYLKFIA